MFSSLSEKLVTVTRDLTGRGRLTEKNIKETMQTIRNALIDADVAYPVVKNFIDRVRSKALGQQILKSIRPGDLLVKLVHDELVIILGENNQPLNLNAQPPVVIMMAGLQGSGKTTTSAKLANWLMREHKKKVLLASVDVYRPAAREQLKILAGQIAAGYAETQELNDPMKIAESALKQAKTQYYDVLIIDTAGRQHIDEAMMAEIKKLADYLNPQEKLFVVDSMMGQDAIHAAQTFNQTLALTGIILTKVDGDARGGAALSAVSVTGTPIKFIGVGEKIDQLQRFHPDRMVSSILGQGDLMTLVEQAKDKIDIEESKKLAQKIKTGKTFTLNDFLKQLEQMQNMGGISSLISKLPGMSGVAEQAKEQINDKTFKRMQAMIQSMTPKERRNVDLIDNSRKRRITAGSGTNIQELNALLKQFRMMQKMMKKMKGPGMLNMLKRLQGQLPPGMV